MAFDLSKVGKREQLTARREPYWQRLRAGCFLGFRPSARGGKGTWIARVYEEDSGKYQMKSLGDFGTLPGNAMFSAAKKEAERLAELIEAGGQLKGKILTVADACKDYAQGRPEAEQRFQRYLYNDPIAKVTLDRLRRRHVMDWRERLISRPALVSRSANGLQVHRKRAASTVNRDMAVLRAALSRAISPGTPNTEAAWQEALRSIRNADGRRTLYLDHSQRRRLLESTSDEGAPFVKALCLLPLRPGALAALRRSDFDPRTSELTIGKDKTGKPRRIKLPGAAAKLFETQASLAPPDSPMFARLNQKAWDRNSWKKPIALAATVAGLPSGTTAYTLRHSTITDLVSAGLPLLTIAQISGTSADMIERHYGHLTSEAATEALNKLSL